MYNKYNTFFPKPFKSKPKNCTELVNHLWDLNSNYTIYPIEYKIVESVKSNTNHTHMFTLCNIERPI